MKLDILYFARLKDSFGMGTEQLETEASSVDELLTECASAVATGAANWLPARPSAWHATKSWCGWMLP
jgi:hypothetical protein